jgi:hypothetical protein
MDYAVMPLECMWWAEDMDGVFHKENGLAASSVEVKFSSVS